MSEGRAFLSMQLLTGGNLAHGISSARPAPKQAALWMSKIARAVHFAHERGILHRDLKPQNILFDDQGEPRVTDFGLAKRVESGDGITLTGPVLGSPSYVSPEAAAGQVKHLTTASDIYSLRAILYELLTGRPPFQGQTPLATLRQVMDTPAERPRTLDPGGWQWVCYESLCRIVGWHHAVYLLTTVATIEQRTLLHRYSYDSFQSTAGAK